jgi:hypothetical protein
MLKIRELWLQQGEINLQQCWCMYKTVLSDCSLVTELTTNRWVGYIPHFMYQKISLHQGNYKN